MSLTDEVPLPSIPIAIASMPLPFLHRARTEGVDDLGQIVKRVEARGGEPPRRPPPSPGRRTTDSGEFLAVYEGGSVPRIRARVHSRAKQ